MRKFFYSISIFIFLCLVSFAYYSTYGLSEKYEELSPKEEQEEIIVPGLQIVSNVEEVGYGKYYLKEKEGYVVVYREDKTTIFETTGIALSSLPEVLQAEIQEGKYVKTEKELYSFLENYSS